MMPRELGLLLDRTTFSHSVPRESAGPTQVSDGDVGVGESTPSDATVHSCSRRSLEGCRGNLIFFGNLTTIMDELCAGLLFVVVVVSLRYDFSTTIAVLCAILLGVAFVSEYNRATFPTPVSPALREGVHRVRGFLTTLIPMDVPPTEDESSSSPSSSSASVSSSSSILSPPPPKRLTHKPDHRKVFDDENRRITSLQSSQFEESLQPKKEATDLDFFEPFPSSLVSSFDF